MKSDLIQASCCGPASIRCAPIRAFRIWCAALVFRNESTSERGVPRCRGGHSHGPAASTRQEKLETGICSYRRIDRQSSKANPTSLLLGPENPSVPWRWNDSGKQQIVEGLALGGIGTGDNRPTGSVPVQD